MNSQSQSNRQKKGGKGPQDSSKLQDARVTPFQSGTEILDTKLWPKTVVVRVLENNRTTSYDYLGGIPGLAQDAWIMVPTSLSEYIISQVGEAKTNFEKALYIARMSKACTNGIFVRNADGIVRYTDNSVRNEVINAAKAALKLAEQPERIRAEQAMETWKNTASARPRPKKPNEWKSSGNWKVHLNALAKTAEDAFEALHLTEAELETLKSTVTVDIRDLNGRAVEPIAASATSVAEMGKVIHRTLANLGANISFTRAGTEEHQPSGLAPRTDFDDEEYLHGDSIDAMLSNLIIGLQAEQMAHNATVAQAYKRLLKKADYAKTQTDFQSNLSWCSGPRVLDVLSTLVDEDYFNLPPSAATPGKVDEDEEFVDGKPSGGIPQQDDD